MDFTENLTTTLSSGIGLYPSKQYYKSLDDKPFEKETFLAQDWGKQLINPFSGQIVDPPEFNLGEFDF